MAADEPSDLLATRRAKLDRLREQGVDPFPHAYPGVVGVATVHEAHADLPDGEETEARYRVAGRIAARRGQGKMAFIDLVDRSGRLQLQARADVLGEDRMELLLALDLGDLLGVDGTAFRSRRGELSLRVEDFAVLAKSLRPPPEKFHGLTDVETRLRRRELDLMANEETRDVFLARARIVSAVRRYLDDSGFIEVETPVLQPLYGGALARPFVTRFKALDQDMYLRIATELYLKRCIVGGLERVYELGKDFRNEGLSPKHNPEFTMVEWYEAYADYGDAMRRLEEVVGAAAGAVGYEGEIDFAAPWRRVTLRDAIREETGIDVVEHRDRDALAAAIGDRFETDDMTWPQLVDDLLSKASSPSSSSRRSSWTTPRSFRRSPRTIAPSPGWWSASRPSPTAWRSPTRSPSSTTPTSSARASRPRRATPSRATRRPSRSTRSSSRRSSTACRRPAASASASTASRWS